MGNKTTLFAVGCYFFFSGVEYAVILPSLNLYLIELEAKQVFIGLVLSSFSIAGLVSGPIYGRITDKTGNSKWVVIISNFFEIGGNILYFMARNPYMVLFSRFLAGVGSGSASSIFGMISRSTTEKQRTGAFSLLMSVRQLGLLIGPACNLFLEDLNFKFGTVVVNQFNSPGLFMAVVWLVHQVLMLFFYKEMTALNEDETENNSIQSNDVLPNHSIINEEAEDQYESPVIVKSSKSFWQLVYKDLFREEVIACLFLNFTLMFIQTGVETMLTPLTLKLFQWGELANSIFFCVAGAVVILGFLIVGLMSKKFEDRTILLFGSIGMFLLYIYFLVYITLTTDNLIAPRPLFIVFVIHSVFLILDLPFVWVPQASLFSKITSRESQAFNQGIRMLAMRMGQILGPLWGGSLINGLPLLVGVNLGLVSLLLMMISLSYKRLRPLKPQRTSHSDVVIANERTPLLHSNGNVVT